ncbi:MAG: AraC family transcriptional regulator [Turicibacter sp.]|nr:AraC family transcriptional regulator [Turicibacter sp.]
MVQQILADFYHCTGITTRLLNAKGAVLEAVGEEALAFEGSLIKDISKLKGGTSLTYGEGTHYVALPLAEQGIIVAGPYQSGCLIKKNNPTYRPVRCNIYFLDLLELIIKQNEADAAPQNTNISKALEFVQKRYADPIALHDVCGYLNLNICYFCTLFKSHVGMTFNNYVNKVRIEKAQELLRQTQLTVIDVAMSVGFNNQGYFTSTFKKFTQMTPTAYRQSFAKDSENKNKDSNRSPLADAV